jgi:hypothetical protein
MINFTGMNTPDSKLFEPVRKIALQFPGAVESVSYGTPSIKVGKKFMCRLHESGDFIPLRMDFEIREKYLESHPVRRLSLETRTGCGFSYFWSIKWSINFYFPLKL